MGSKDHRRQKDGGSTTNSGNSNSNNNSNTYSAFRQWRRSTSMGSHNNRSSSTGSRSSNSLVKLPNDPATIRKLEQFPLVLSDATMPDEDLSLKFLALVRTLAHFNLVICRSSVEETTKIAMLQNALDLTAPASDVLLKNRLKSWFQLSGHPDGFAPAGPGTVWKRRTGGTENTERTVYETLSKDEALRDCIPRFDSILPIQIKKKCARNSADNFTEFSLLLVGIIERSSTRVILLSSFKIYCSVLTIHM